MKHQVYARYCAKAMQLWIRQLEHSPSLHRAVRGGDRHKQVINDTKENQRSDVMESDRTGVRGGPSSVKSGASQSVVSCNPRERLVPRLQQDRKELLPVVQERPRA